MEYSANTDGHGTNIEIYVLSEDDTFAVLRKPTHDGMKFVMSDVWSNFWNRHPGAIGEDWLSHADDACREYGWTYREYLDGF